MYSQKRKWPDVTHASRVLRLGEQSSVRLRSLHEPPRRVPSRRLGVVRELIGVPTQRAAPVRAIELPLRVLDVVDPSVCICVAEPNAARATRSDSSTADASLVSLFPRRVPRGSGALEPRAVRAPPPPSPPPPSRGRVRLVIQPEQIKQNTASNKYIN